MCDFEEKEFYANKHRKIMLINIYRSLNDFLENDSFLFFLNV